MKMKAFLMFVLLFLCSMGTKAQDLGACGLAPVVTIAGKVYGRLTPEKVRDILSEYYLLEQV